MRDLLIDLHYLPGVEFFVLLQSFDRVYLEAKEHYQKQTLRNRCYIRGANGVQRLTVPVLKPSGAMPITEIQVDYGQHWIRNHVRSIRSAYGNAPYFEHFAEELFSVMADARATLFETNWQLLQRCLRLLGIQKEMHRTDQYRAVPEAGCLDMRDVFDATGTARKGITIEYDRYQQVFNGGFERNMSIVDLLFCEGPDALQVVQAGRVILNDPEE